MEGRVFLDLWRGLPRQRRLQLCHDVAPQVLDDVFQRFSTECPKVVLVLAAGTRHHHARLLAHAKRILFDIVLQFVLINIVLISIPEISIKYLTYP